MRQQPAGLAGVLVVLEPGARFDAATDHPLLLSTPRRLADREDHLYLNGSLAPPALEGRAGEEHRLRVVNIALAPPGGYLLALLRDSAVGSWRPVAKDGAELPAEQATPQPARTRVSTGETADFIVTLAEPGTYRLEVRPANNPLALRAVLRIRILP